VKFIACNCISLLTNHTNIHYVPVEVTPKFKSI